MFVSFAGHPELGVIKANGGDLSGLDAIIDDPNPLRDRNLLTAENGKQVDGLDVVLAGQSLDKPTKLRLVGGTWKLYGGPNDPQNADRSAVAKIADVILAKRVIKDFRPSTRPTSRGFP